MTYAATLKELKNDVRSLSDTYPELAETWQSFGTHCFRRFGATLCKVGGIPDDITQYLGRWVSDCFQRYLMFSDDNKVEMSRAMVDSV